VSGRSSSSVFSFSKPDATCWASRADRDGCKLSGGIKYEMKCNHMLGEKLQHYTNTPCQNPLRLDRQDRQQKPLCSLPVLPKNIVKALIMLESQLISREPESVWVAEHGKLQNPNTSVQHMHLQLLVCYAEDQVDVGPHIARAGLILCPPHNTNTGLVFLTGSKALAQTNAGRVRILSYCFPSLPGGAVRA